LKQPLKQQYSKKNHMWVDVRLTYGRAESIFMVEYLREYKSIFETAHE
jgi:hypothetical protein